MEATVDLEPLDPGDGIDPYFPTENEYETINYPTCSAGVYFLGTVSNWTDGMVNISAGDTLRVTKTGGIWVGNSHSGYSTPAAPIPQCALFNLAIAIFPPGVTPMLQGGTQSGVQYLKWNTTSGTPQPQQFLATVSGRVYVAFNDYVYTYSDNQGAYCVGLSVCARPTVPTGLTVTVLPNADCSLRLTLTWNPVATATGYVVTRNGVAQPQQSGPSATFVGELSQTETFTVRALNGCGESGESVPLVFVPEVPDIPAPVVSLCQSCCRERVKVSVSPVANATGYTVERDGIPLASFLPGAFFVDDTVDAATEYTYTVRTLVGCFTGAPGTATIRIRGWQTAMGTVCHWQTTNYCVSDSDETCFTWHTPGCDC